MILFSRSVPLVTLQATQLQGGYHGTRDQAQRQRIRSARPSSVFDRLGRRLSELPDHFDVRRRRHHRVDRGASWLHDLYGEACEKPVPHRRDRRSAADQTPRAAQSSDGGISRCHEESRWNEPAGARLRLLDLVGSPTCCPPGESDRDPIQRRSDETAVASRGLFGSSPQAQHEGEARRGCLRNGQEAIAPAKKKALKKDAPEALVFQDEVEVHRHPTLSRMWAPVGKQPEIPAPGQNEKKVVYGGVDYVTGKITYTVADSKSGMNFLIFLAALVKSYAGRRIRLVCDNGRFHHTHAIKEWLEANSDRITIYWLPPYSPSLNLIERLWGHLKRTVLANVLFETLDDLTAAFRKGVGRVNGHRDRMGFMYDHDDVLGKTG